MRKRTFGERTCENARSLWVGQWVVGGWVVGWYSGRMVQWYSGTMVQEWYSGTVASQNYHTTHGSACTAKLLSKFTPPTNSVASQNYHTARGPRKFVGSQSTNKVREPKNFLGPRAVRELCDATRLVLGTPPSCIKVHTAHQQSCITKLSYRTRPKIIL